MSKYTVGVLQEDIKHYGQNDANSQSLINQAVNSLSEFSLSFNHYRVYAFYFSLS